MSGVDPWSRAAEVWLTDAAEDLEAALKAASHVDLLPRHIGFLAQQAAEKAIKAALTYARSPEWEAIHNLTRLVERLPDDGTWQTRRKYTNLGGLSLFAVEARYRINDVPVTARQAHTACNLAKGIYQSCLADMVAHGFRHAQEPKKAGG